MRTVLSSSLGRIPGVLPTLSGPLPRRQLLVAAAGAGLTAVMLLEPSLRVQVQAPTLRIPFEVLGASLVMFAAVMMGVPEGEDVRPARSAFLSGLLILALSNIWLTAQLTANAGVAAAGVQYWPWVGARYLVSVFFVLAGLERPRVSLQRYVAAALLAWFVIEYALWLAPDTQTSALVQDPAPALVIVQLVPALLFGVGAWLAGRLHDQRRAPEYAWLSLALEVQVIAQVHETFVPAYIGPVLTSADAFRMTSFLLLLVGAVEQLRRVYRERAEAVRLQQEDLRLRESLVSQLGAFAEREADFRTLVSHELATPIAAIRALVHVLDRRLRSTTHDGRVTDALEGLRAESARLVQLVDRMDELRELELSEFECDLRPVLLGPLLEDAALFAQAVGRGHRVEVRADEVRVHADPVRLGQALRNVLNNAVRYAPAASVIVIDGARSGQDAYRLQISDDGPGIPQVERAQVLKPFVRGSTAGTTDGRGVGLYVVQRILAAHGGTVEVTSAPSGGASIVLEMRTVT